jgi:DNA-directed RNA polymerase sigma subunit (sigma70/sigma32)
MNIKKLRSDLSKFSNIEHKHLTEDDVLKHLLAANVDHRSISIVKHRYCLFDHDFQTLQQLGKTYSMSKERIRQLSNIALRKIRNKITDR